MNKKYYNLHMLDNEDGSVGTTSEHDFGEYFKLPNTDELAYPFILDEGVVEDYLASDLGWPLMSEQMKLLFDKFNTNAVHWTKAKVYDQRKNKTYSYHIMSFKTKLDLLDKSKTYFSDEELIIVPVFSLSNIHINKLDYFPQPDEYDFNIVVSEEMKLQMEKMKLTGIDFSEASVS